MNLWKYFLTTYIRTHNGENLTDIKKFQFNSVHISMKLRKLTNSFHFFVSCLLSSISLKSVLLRESMDNKKSCEKQIKKRSFINQIRAFC